ncbi:MAG: VWA domain-containing protein [Cyclobacteriaceae bacterium]|nr:VWA domain-containing protein [Cyclobacteriaceae bacterium]
MDQQRLLFEYSPAFVLLSVGLGLLYAYLLYQTKNSWGKNTNRVLFALRTVLVFFLAFLLIGPILKLTINEYEKPALVFLIDNSTSVHEAVDSLKWEESWEGIQKSMDNLRSNGFEVEVSTLDGPRNEIQFDQSTSDLNGAVRDIVGKYEGKNLAGVVVYSDGIYNSGSSPLYSPTRMPVYTVGIGDTTERIDVVLRNVLYNKIAYEGNQFPLRAEVMIHGLQNQDIRASVYRKGKLIARDQKNSGGRSLIDFDFQIDASEKGLQRLDIVIDQVSGERNKKNNSASAFVEVVEGKKKILLVASAPHPDIKTLASVVEKNANYEFIIHIPGVKDAPADALKIENIDLAIFHQAIDYSGKTVPLFKSMMESSVSMLVTLGERSNLRQLAANGIPLTYETPGQWDAVTPIINANFKDFGFSENMNSVFARYPPVNVPFGKFTYPTNANVLLFQRIGRVATDRPFLFTLTQNDQKLAVMTGDGVWRWRMDEFAETQKTEAFDDVFSKLIQYLSTREDRRKFRSFPVQNEFTASEPVEFESQVYNELFEQVYGNKIDINLTNESGEKFEYSYVTSPGNSRYRIGGLGQGVYQFRSSTELNGARETVRGEFLITEQNIESQNLTADFNLLRKWAANTGGRFYKAEDLNQLEQDFSRLKASSRIHSEESFNPLINLKLVFFLLLTLISLEWFIRKYMGSY